MLKSTVIDCYQHDICNSSCTETLGDNTCQQDNLTEALCNLLMDIDVETCEVTKHPSKHDRTILKGLQPYREKPSKDRRRRFYCGSLYGDSIKPDEHDVELFDFWAIKPTSEALCQAQYFLVAQIIHMVDLEKPCDSNNSCNKNLHIIFEVYKYQHTMMTYTPDGRSGMLRGHKTLICCISKEKSFYFQKGVVKFNSKEVVALQDFLPYHDEADIDQRLVEFNYELTVPSACDEDHTDEPYIVEKVLQKRFHSHRNQYEFLVSWVGYTDTTWETADNVPLEKISQYESGLTCTKSRSGRIKKPVTKEGYIKTF